MREVMRKALRHNLKAGVALVGLIVIGVVVGGYILSNQRLNPPAWVPVVGEHSFELRAEIESVQGVLPGQGQSVNISGVKVGDIASVELEDGRAIATLRIEPRFEREVYPDATVLLRPKTGLKDMVAELDPGSPTAGAPLVEGATIANASTNPDVNLDEFWGSLDGDTRSYLQLLVGDGARALGDGGGRDLANTLRGLQPLSRDIDRASRYVAERRRKLERVMHNFSAIVSELGAHDQELARFVSGSAAVFRRLANQNANLAETIELLPATLESGNTALAKLDRLGQAMATTFSELRPTARALGPTLRDLRPFLARTTPAIRDQLRPFTREVQPIARELKRPASDLAAATPDLLTFFEVLNALFDELAYDPPGREEGYLFYVPWANHNTNSTLSSQDGIGPLRRGVLLASCAQLSSLEGIFDRIVETTGARRNPTASTLLELLSLPDCEEGDG